MRDSIKAREYLPSIYDGFLEMESIIKTDDTLLDIAEAELRNLMDNQWILLAHEDGIKHWEQMLNIVPNLALEDLEFRRTRILNRVSSRVPFTKISLEQKLDSIIGIGNYVLTIDNNKYIIYLESSASNQIWYSEILLTMNNMKPCNMVFVNTPLVTGAIGVEETVNYSERLFNYKLGSGFQLGMRPFITIRDEVVVKLANTASAQAALLNSIASFTVGEIASVLINDSISITNFEIKSASNNLVTVSYIVTSSQASEVTNIKLRDSAGRVLTSAPVYVPITDSIIMKHTILVKEG